MPYPVLAGSTVVFKPGSVLDNLSCGVPGVGNRTLFDLDGVNWAGVPAAPTQITRAERLTGWTANGDGTWSIPRDLSNKNADNEVFTQGDQPLYAAQYPTPDRLDPVSYTHLRAHET